MWEWQLRSVDDAWIVYVLYVIQYVVLVEALQEGGVGLVFILFGSCHDHYLAGLLDV